MRNKYKIELRELPPTHSYVYDADGNEVSCPICNGEVIYDADNNYICFRCKTIIQRDDFFELIGVKPAGPKCSTCKNIYPGCDSCPYGYVATDYI